MTDSRVADCPRCDAPVGSADKYCTSCGYSLEEQPAIAAVPPTARAAAQAPAITTCPACSAVNAASRMQCARCHADLDGGYREHSGELPALRPAEPAAPKVGEEEAVSKSLLAVTIVAALTVAAVILMLLAARGLGIGSSPSQETPAPGEHVALEIVGVTASSALPASGSGSYGPQNLLDDDPETAWNEGVEGDGAGEWVEFTLSEPRQITRLMLWNGHQKGQLFFDNARVKTLRIEAGERTLLVELLDRRGPQAVDLREPVEADRIRLTIDDVYPGDRYADTALSAVQLFGAPPDAEEGSDAQPEA